MYSRSHLISPTIAIAVPGAGGKGGGVSGSTASFFVATGTGLVRPIEAEERARQSEKW